MFKRVNLIKNYAVMYQQYHQEIYRFFCFKVSSTEVAQELTQEVFLKVWQYIKEGSKAVNNVRALLYKVARNLVVDYYRKEKGDLLEESAADNLVAESNIAEQVDLSFQSQHLYCQLKKLNSEYQEVINLRYMKGLSHKEIAQVLNKRQGAVRVILHRAMKELQRIMTAQ